MEIAKVDVELVRSALRHYAQHLNQALITDQGDDGRHVLTERSKGVLGSAAIRADLLAIELERETRFEHLAEALKPAV